MKVMHRMYKMAARLSNFYLKIGLCKQNVSIFENYLKCTFYWTLFACAIIMLGFDCMSEHFPQRTVPQTSCDQIQSNKHRVRAMNRRNHLWSLCRINISIILSSLYSMQLLTFTTTVLLYWMRRSSRSRKLRVPRKTGGFRVYWITRPPSHRVLASYSQHQSWKEM